MMAEVIGSRKVELRWEGGAGDELGHVCGLG